MDELKKCYEYAIKYLSRFPKTESEMIIKLRQKHFDEEIVQKVISELKKEKYLDDDLFVEMYIGSELIGKGKPESVVIAKLLSKGVDKTLIMEKISKKREEIENGVIEKIKKEIQKYKNKGLEGFDIVQKLLRKGYKYQDIKKAVEM